MVAPEIEDFDHVVLTARDLGATIEVDGATGELNSVWFRDPNGNLIEVANRA